MAPGVVFRRKRPKPRFYFPANTIGGKLERRNHNAAMRKARKLAAKKMWEANPQYRIDRIRALEERDRREQAEDYRHLSPAERADASERASRRRRGISPNLTAGYRRFLGPAPQCLPGDRRSALLYLARIRLVMDMSGSEEAGGSWTRSEWSRLSKLYKRWQKRATGSDARFNLIGNKSCGLNKEQQERVKMARETITALPNGGVRWQK